MMALLVLRRTGSSWCSKSIRISCSNNSRNNSNSCSRYRVMIGRQQPRSITTTSTSSTTGSSCTSSNCGGSILRWQQLQSQSNKYQCNVRTTRWSSSSSSNSGCSSNSRYRRRRWGIGFETLSLIQPNHQHLYNSTRSMNTGTDTDAAAKSNNTGSRSSNSNSNSKDSPNNNDSDNNDLVTMSIDTLGICTIVLNRPQKLNALNIPMFTQLQSILHTILQNQQRQRQSSSSSVSSSVLSALSSTLSSSIGDSNNNKSNNYNNTMNLNAIRVILVRGEGRAFCTGLDIPSIIRDMTNVFHYNNSQSTFDSLLQRHPLPDYIVQQQQQESNPTPTSIPQSHHGDGDDDDSDSETVPPDIKDAVQAIAQTNNLVQDIAYLWRQIDVPVIGCIHGMCYGGGLQMILGMDIRYVQTGNTKLSIMESKWGLIPDMGATITLRELIAIDIAKELTFTGRVITGEEAVQYGLVTKCVDDPIQAGYQLAIEMIDQSPEVLRYSKQLYQSTYRTGMNEHDCLLLENKYQNQLLLSYNQIIASIRTKFGWKCIPYISTK